jgi:hypothetical protein
MGELAANWYDADYNRNEAEVLAFAKLLGAAAGALLGDGSAQSVQLAQSAAE